MALVSSGVVSLSPLSSVSWSERVFVSRLGWCASSQSVLVFVSGSPVPLTCRVGSADSSAVSAMVALLRSARDTGSPVLLGTRRGWSPSEWFCAVLDSEDPSATVAVVSEVVKPLPLVGAEPAESADERAARREAELAAIQAVDERASRIAELKEQIAELSSQRSSLHDELDLLEASRDLADWEYYGFSSPEDFVGAYCGVACFVV